MAAGRYDEAIKAFSDVAAQHPSDPKPIYLRGECYRKMGKLKESEADLRAAIKLDPSGKDEQIVIVMAELGAVLSDAGRASEAIEMLDQAVKLRPDLFEAYYNLGVAHESLKHWPEAIAAYGKAIKLKPQDANPRASQADAQQHAETRAGDALQRLLRRRHAADVVRRPAALQRGHVAGQQVRRGAQEQGGVRHGGARSGRTRCRAKGPTGTPSAPAAAPGACPS